MTQVLHGVRVVDQGTFITGSYAAMLLADLGADVIKVEGPDGDPYRRYQEGAYSPHFQAYNRNKRSLALDLKRADDRALFDRLILGADVYIQNFRPGAAQRLDAGEPRLRGLNPRLVYCSLSGFGASGPYADRPSYDSVAQALSGFLSVVVDTDRPRFLGPALADAITGLYGAYGILGALVARARTGVGSHVELSMLEAMAHFAVEPFAAFFALGERPTSNDRPRLAQAYILRTRDGGMIAIHLSSIEKFWTGLVAALEAPQLAADPRFSSRLSRIEHYEALGRELDDQFRRHTTAQCAARLAAHDVPFAPLNSIDQVPEDPQVQHMQMIVPTHALEGARFAVRPPVQYDGVREASVTAAPLLNQHGEAIRQALASGAEWPGAAAPDAAAGGGGV